jgi:hypothetical protein
MAKKKSGLDQVVKFEKDSPTAVIIGKTSVKRKDLITRFWYGNGSKKKGIKSATGNSIYKLKLQGGPGDTVKYKKADGKMGVAKGGQVIHSGDNEVWKQFANGKNKIAMMQLMSLYAEDQI